MGKCLPGKLSERIREQRELRKLTQSALAEKIGIAASTLCRIEGGSTENVSGEIIAALAREFKVSTDYLLGLTDYSTRMNADWEKAGLSAEAVNKLVSGRVDADIINRVITSRCAARLSDCIAGYLSGSLCEGLRLQNEIMKQAMGLTMDVPEAHSTVSALRPLPNLEMENMKKQFEYLLVEMKRRSANEPPETDGKSTAMIQAIIEAAKKLRAEQGSISPAQLTELILKNAELASGVETGALSAFYPAICQLFDQPPRRSADGSDCLQA